MSSRACLSAGERRCRAAAGRHRPRTPAVGQRRHPSTRQGRDERGGAALLTIACAGVLLLLGSAFAVIAAVFVAHRTAQGAADLAALAAAADAQHGGDACSRAAAIAEANGADLASCARDGPDVIVHTTVAGPAWLGWVGDPVGEARAGPAG